MSFSLEMGSPCKVNLLLNILGKRPDGFHELETLMQPVALQDTLRFERVSTAGVELVCDHPQLPVHSDNLVVRAALRFFEKTGIGEGVRIQLEKRIPLAAGLGGGSSNAAITLRGLNQLFGGVLSPDELQVIAAQLGSDVPFFLQTAPALATGRGERVTSLRPFQALQGSYLLLIHPGFGVSTAWAYQALAQYPAALNGERGRGQQFLKLLEASDLGAVGRALFNSLEAPVLRKYPILELYQNFLRDNGAAGALMSGSGSTTFALAPDRASAERLAERFRGEFGSSPWLAVTPV